MNLPNTFPLLFLASALCCLRVSQVNATESPSDCENLETTRTCHAQQDPTILQNGRFQTLPQDMFQQITDLPSNTLLNDNDANLPSRYAIPGGESISLQYIRDFIPTSTLEHIINLCNARNGWTSSPQSLNGKSTVKATRTSRSCPLIWPQLYLPLRDKAEYASRLEPISEELDVTWALTQRIASLLNVGEEYIEPFQLVRYLPGEFYKEHHDHGGYYGVETEQRPWTLLVFLSNVPSSNGHEGGGYTLFKELGEQDDGGIAIVPRMGDAVLWANVDDDTGEVLREAVHEAIPPKDGGDVVKYAMNVWIADKKIKENMDVSAYRTK